MSNSGWLRIHHHGGQAPQVPSEWESLLSQLGVSEKAVLARKHVKAAQLAEIERWVRAKHRVRYVPTKMLEHLEIPIWVD